MQLVLIMADTKLKSIDNPLLDGGTVRRLFLALLASLCLIPSTGLAQEDGDWLLRTGVVNFAPSDGRGLLQTSVGDNLAGSSISLDDNSQLGVTISYMITDSWAIEAAATASFKHEVAINGLDAFGLTTTELGDTYLVTPTVSALYYFGSPSRNLRPYIGAGINYTRFFNASLGTQARSELGAENLEFDHSFGIEFRAGLDWELRNGWFMNASVSRINMDTTASFQTGERAFSSNITLDPWITMFTLGHKF